jgi:hypothetical protein
VPISAKWRWLTSLGVCSGDIYVLESLDADVLLPELLPFICQADAFFEHAVGNLGREPKSAHQLDKFDGF